MQAGINAMMSGETARAMLLVVTQRCQCAVKSAGLQWEKSETEDPPGNFRSAGSSWSGEVQ